MSLCFVVQYGKLWGVGYYTKVAESLPHTMWIKYKCWPSTEELGVGVSYLWQQYRQRFCRVCIVDCTCSSAAATLSVESLSTTTKLCGHAIAKKYPTNLWTHLKNNHPLEYKELLQKDERQKADKAEKAKVKNPWVWYEPKWHLAKLSHVNMTEEVGNISL